MTGGEEWTGASPGDPQVALDHFQLIILGNQLGVEVQEWWEVSHLHVEWPRDDEGLGDGAGHLGRGWLIRRHLAYLGEGLLVDVVGRCDERGVAGVHPRILHVLAHRHAYHLGGGREALQVHPPPHPQLQHPHLSPWLLG